MQIQITSLKDSFKTPEVILAFDAIDGRFAERFAPYESRTVTRIATIIDPKFKKPGFLHPEQCRPGVPWVGGGAHHCH